jgi:hypothetical protein
MVTGRDFFAVADGPELGARGDLDRFRFCVCRLPFALVCEFDFEARDAANWDRSVGY